MTVLKYFLEALCGQEEPLLAFKGGKYVSMATGPSLHSWTERGKKESPEKEVKPEYPPYGIKPAPPYGIKTEPPYGIKPAPPYEIKPVPGLGGGRVTVHCGLVDCLHLTVPQG